MLGKVVQSWSSALREILKVVLTEFGCAVAAVTQNPLGVLNLRVIRLYLIAPPERVPYPMSF